MSISTFMHKPILTNYHPSGYWRKLWSSLDFADQPLKICVNIIHVDIVEIWNLCDKTKVSYPQSLGRFNRFNGISICQTTDLK